MAMNVGPAGGNEDEMVSTINTTPLVDVMLVLLIIFLITIPVVTETVPLQLPHEVNQPNQTKREDITISVREDGSIYWNNRPVADAEALFQRLAEIASLQPQPEIHIRGDQEARFETVNRVVTACQRAAIQKVSFITEPPIRGAG